MTRLLHLLCGIGSAAVLLSTAAAAAPGTCPAFVSGSEGLPQTTEWRTHPAFGDVNGDGHLDLAAHPRKAGGPVVFLGDGGRHWRLEEKGLRLPAMGCGVGVDLADVNADGHLDLGVADHCHGVFVFLGDGKGSWRMAGRPLAKTGHEDLEFGDLDGDGHLDVVAVGSFAGGIAVFQGDGRGGFKTLRDTGLPRDGIGRDVKLADINGDGRLDVAATFTAAPGAELGQGPEHNLVWLSDAQGHYREASEGLPAHLQQRSVALGDVNGDGKVDLASSSVPFGLDQLPLYVYLGNGGTAWTLAAEGLPRWERGLSFSGVEFGDLNRDGHADLVATTWLGAGIRVWLGDGTGRWQECPNAGLPKDRQEIRGWGVTVGDVNGDGRSDLAAAFGKQGAGRLEVWLQRGR